MMRNHGAPFTLVQLMITIIVLMVVTILPARTANALKWYGPPTSEIWISRLSERSDSGPVLSVSSGESEGIATSPDQVLGMLWWRDAKTNKVVVYDKLPRFLAKVHIIVPLDPAEFNRQPQRMTESSIGRHSPFPDYVAI